jgi:hypothetical protein
LHQLDRDPREERWLHLGKEEIVRAARVGCDGGVAAMGKWRKRGRGAAARNGKE